MAVITGIREVQDNESDIGYTGEVGVNGLVFAIIKPPSLLSQGCQCSAASLHVNVRFRVADWAWLGVGLLS